jgi:hypothetical protein
MNDHERIPQDRKMLPLNPGLMKKLTTTATEAIPTELPKRHLKWLTERRGRHMVVAEAIGNALCRPPTLRNALPQWRRFYAMLFNYEMPRLDDPICEELAEGFIVVGKSMLTTSATVFDLTRRMPGVFSQDFAEGASSIRTLVESRDFPWYVMRLTSRDYRDHSFEYDHEGDLETGVSFREVLVQQLFEYFSGRPLSNKWLYANGSRTRDDLVPAVMGKKGKIAIGLFKRNSIHHNVSEGRMHAFG